jgi:protease-4
MKKTAFLIIVSALALNGCSPHLHLDFLGQEKLEEIVLVPSGAKDKIVVIDVEGMISTIIGSGPFAREKNIVSSVYLRLRRAAEDPSVKAVILRLDTPGGEVTASDILYHEIMKFKKETPKPVVGLMMGVAASGGYYVASACDVIMAHPTTLTGSIGVISVFPSVAGLMDKIGVKIEVVKSGEAKDSGGFFRDMTEEDRKIWQGIIDEYYGDFLDVVAANRKERITPDRLKTAADGRVFTARQALDLNLIDEIGYLDDALRKARSLAGLRGAKVVGYSYYPKTKTNIYASELGDFSPLDHKVLESYLNLLKTGFYFLWLPEGL